VAEGTQGHGQVVAPCRRARSRKIALFYEFARSLPRESCRILRSGSISSRKATAYGPIIDLLKNYFNVYDRDDHRAIREKVIKPSP
jgi:hypothetical protein